MSNDAKGSDYMYSRCLKLPGEAKLASWPTPMAGSPATDEYNAAGNNDFSRRVVTLTSWATPTTRDHKDGAANLESVPVNALLGRQALLAGWRSPDTNTCGGAQDPEKRIGHALRLQDEVRLTSGPTPSGSTAATASGGQLNPAFSRWLMGLPEAWDACAPHSNDWALIQSWLARSFATPEAEWDWLAATVLADFAATATRSARKRRSRSSRRT
jgi:hypothetical protein